MDPRTKQYIQDKEFGATMLFYPAVVGQELIPDGLPQGPCMVSTEREGNPKRGRFGSATVVIITSRAV